MIPLRICFVCNEYPPGPHGGIGTFTQITARALAGAGHEVRVVGVYSQNCPGPNRERDGDVAVFRMRKTAGRIGGLQTRYRLFRRIAAWARKGEIDLVELPDWQGWAACWPRLPVPIVVRANGSACYFAALANPTRKPPLISSEKASLRRADFWCAVSQYTADRTHKLFGLRSPCSAILYNVVESPNDTDTTTRSKNQVVFTGTLVRKKGILSLIDAWPDVLQAYPQAELQIFGKDGKNEDELSMETHLRRRLDGLASRSVHFHGHVTRERIFQALRSARAAVFPSYAEAFALAPLEAMGRGCPTIYSCRCSGPELIEHNKNGLLVAPDNSEDIASAIIRLLGDDQLAAQFGESARKTVEERFTIETQLPQTEAFYSQCIELFRVRPSRPPASQDPGENVRTPSQMSASL